MTTIEETLTKLTELRLTSMAMAVRELMQTAPGHQLSFDEKLGIVVDRVLPRLPVDARGADLAPSH